MWINDQTGTVLINLDHIRSIEISNSNEVIAIYGEMRDKDGEPLYERFVLYEGSEKGDDIDYLFNLSKKLKAIDWHF
jgi:hypothetical protein